MGRDVLKVPPAQAWGSVQQEGDSQHRAAPAAQKSLVKVRMSHLSLAWSKGQQRELGELMRSKAGSEIKPGTAAGPAFVPGNANVIYGSD